MKKRLIQFLVSSFIMICIVIAGSYYWVEWSTSELVKSDIQRIQSQKVGLLLGTSRYLQNGKVNPFYQNRIEAICDLYFAGKIKSILVSGDNNLQEYNEPRMIWKDLVAKGIPENAIYLDFAGFRTLDSVVRAKEIFGQKKLIMVSQKYHLHRACFIARTFGMKVQGFEAESPDSKKHENTYLREVPARIKMFLDLYILRTKPKFLGEKITIV